MSAAAGSERSLSPVHDGGRTDLILFVFLVALVPLLQAIRSLVLAQGLLPAPSANPSSSPGEMTLIAATMLGAGTGLFAIAGLAVAILLAIDRPVRAALLAVAPASASFAVQLLKDAYHAPRPPQAATYASLALHVPLVAGVLVVCAVLIAARRTQWGPAGLAAGVAVLAALLLDGAAQALAPVEPGFDSFPSGHAGGSMAFCSAVIVVAWPVRRRRPLLALAVCALAAMFAVLVGISRVYLGAHYPADVLAGWCVGLASTIACRRLLSLLPLTAPPAAARAPLQTASAGESGTRPDGRARGAGASGLPPEA